MKLVNSSLNTIWRYNGLYKTKIGHDFLVKLQENFTNLENIHIGEQRIFLKREDESIVGSHKFRPLSYQVAYLLQSGVTRVTLSSSGNAAIALSGISERYPIESFIFISPQLEEAKKNEIQTNRSVVVESDFAPRFSNYLSKKIKIPQLRPSKDDNAIEGYKSLGFELFEQNNDIDAVFMCITSGASLLGVYEAWQQIINQFPNVKLPALYCVFGEGTLPPHRIHKVVEVVKLSGGQVCEVSEDQIDKAKEVLKLNEKNTSIEGVKALAACKNILQHKKYENPVVIFSGANRVALKSVKRSFPKINTLVELDAFIDKIKT